MKTLTEDEVRKGVSEAVAEIVERFKDEPDTDRHEVIDALDEAGDDLFGSLTGQHGRIDKYDADDLAATAGPCATIVRVAKEDAWVEDDSGLWDGLVFGVLASIAFFSLRNLLYQGLTDAGHDSNDRYPFAKEDAEVDAS